MTARADVALAGDRKRAGDFTTWAKDDEALGVYLGGAVHWQLGDAHNADHGSESGADYLAGTVDLSIERYPVHLDVAGTGGWIDYDTDVNFLDGAGNVIGTATNPERAMYGVLVQGGYKLTDRIEPFARWEWIDADNIDNPGTAAEVQMLTLGVNYYLRGHNAKLTLDGVWVYDQGTLQRNAFGNSAFSDGPGVSGFAGDGDDLYACERSFNCCSDRRLADAPPHRPIQIVDSPRLRRGGDRL